MYDEKRPPMEASTRDDLPRALLRWAFWAMLLLCVIASAGDHLGWSPVLVFFLAGIGTIPAAGLLGRATEEIALGITSWRLGRGPAGHSTADAVSFGARVGGLLNATLGNLPELIVGILALQQGYVNLTKATIVGSVIGNVSLVLGAALFAGGARNGAQHFEAQEAGHHAVLMAMAVAGLLLPSIFLSSTHSTHVTEISTIGAVLLIGTYLAYLLYSMFEVHGGSGGSDPTFIEEEAEIVQAVGEEHPAWSLRTSLIALAVAALLVFVAAEALIDTVKPFAHTLGWSPVFVGIIIIPILSNIAEHSSAVVLALKNKTDMALGVASGSSIQVAVFVAPVLVIASRLWHQLDLAFTSLEIAALAIVVGLFYLVSRDGESNWLEGFQLVAIYGLIATVFFFVPGQL